jgi:hypothetical protein
VEFIHRLASGGNPEGPMASAAPNQEAASHEQA